jgi:hypothetical protein
LAHDNKRKQAIERHGLDHAKINRRNRIGMIAQEGSPGLRRRPTVPEHVRLYGPAVRCKPDLTIWR